MKKETSDGELTCKETDITYEDEVCFSLRNNKSEKTEIKQTQHITNNSKSERNYKHVNINIKLKLLIVILSCLCTCLDGFIQIFLGYNSSILYKELNWDKNYIIILDIIYHFVSAFGGIISIFTSHFNFKNGLCYGSFFSISAFLLTLPLMNIKNFSLYTIIFFFICLSNGHLQNMSINLIVQKFSSKYRAFIYVFSEMFNQIGKLIFASIIYKFNDLIIQGQITLTVFPILIIILFQIVVTLILVKTMHEKIKEKKKIQNENTTYSLKMKNTKEVSLKNIIYDPFKRLFIKKNLKQQSFILIVLNLSLGIQYYSVINVYAELDTNNMFSDITDEIFFSKVIHTIGSIFLPILFITKGMSRRFLLMLTFTINIVLNLVLVFQNYDPSIILHLFRFVWNLSFITTNLYCSEIIPKSLMNMNSSLMFLIFRLSCIFEILMIDNIISMSIYLPLILNVIILIFDTIFVSKLEIETHLKSLKEIENEINKNEIYN